MATKSPQGPTARELAAIEDEWPVIEAELAVVTAECRLAMSPDVLSLRAHARAVGPWGLFVAIMPPCPDSLTF